MTAFEKRLNDPDPKVHLPAARAWSVYEGSCSTLLPSPQPVAAFGEERHALGLSRLEGHYFRNGIFMEEGQLLAEVPQIRHIPPPIVRGRFANVCPIHTAVTPHPILQKADQLGEPTHA